MTLKFLGFWSHILHKSQVEMCPTLKSTWLSFSFSFLFFLLKMENVRFTTPIQQLYNNPSYEGRSHILGPTLM
jgi:hypothetical protein